MLAAEAVSASGRMGQLHHPEVHELPWIIAIQLVVEQALPSFERVQLLNAPVSVSRQGGSSP